MTVSKKIALHAVRECTPGANIREVQGYPASCWRHYTQRTRQVLPSLCSAAVNGTAVVAEVNEQSQCGTSVNDPVLFASFAQGNVRGSFIAIVSGSFPWTIRFAYTSLKVLKVGNAGRNSHPMVNLYWSYFFASWYLWSGWVSLCFVLQGQHLHAYLELYVSS